MCQDGLQRPCKHSLMCLIQVNQADNASRIFVPCRDGVSHNPAEYCSPDDCGNGAQTLLGAVLRYDRLRAQRGY